MNGQVMVTQEGGEYTALVSMADFLRLNAGGDFWGALRAEALAGGMKIFSPTGSPQHTEWRTDKGGLVAVPEAELEALHRAGYDTYELPDAVAEMVTKKAEELDISPKDLMEIVADNRTAEDQLSKADIERGFKLAEERYGAGRNG